MFTEPQGQRIFYGSLVVLKINNEAQNASFASIVSTLLLDMPLSPNKKIFD